MRRTAMLLLALLIGLAALQPAAWAEAQNGETPRREAAGEAAEREETTDGEANAAAASKGQPAGETRYAIDVTLNRETCALTGTATISFSNASGDAWPQIVLRNLIQSVWKDAELRGTEPTMETRITRVALASTGEALAFSEKPEDASVIRVQLPEPLQPGESTEIRVEYASEIPCGGFRTAWFSNDTDAWPPEHMTCELAYFYPTLAMYTEQGWSESPYYLEGECDFNPVSAYDVIVHAPEGVQVICGGAARQLSDTEWRLTGTRMRDFVLIVSDELERLDGSAGDVAIHSYYYRDDEGSRRQGEWMLEAAQNAVRAFEQAYGPYPFDELKVVESHYEQGGMEHAGLVRISTSFSWELDREAAEETARRLADDVAHEVAHQWFYAAVGNDPYNEAWLDESFAAYSELVYRRFMGESEAQLAEAVRQMKREADERYAGAINRSHAELEADGYSYIPAVYRRGKVFLYELEQRIGADRFGAFLREWVQSHAFQTVTTADFLAALEPYMAQDDGLRVLVGE